MQDCIGKMNGGSVERFAASSWRGSQVVRHGSAKAVFVGSIPTLASNVLWSGCGLVLAADLRLIWVD